jgi:hypothetical protein
VMIQWLLAIRLELLCTYAAPGSEPPVRNPT